MSTRERGGRISVVDVYSHQRWITVVETKVFQARSRDCLSESEVEALITTLACDPLCGAVIPGTGGLRKLRVATGGHGKRGAVRVIYYFYNETMPVFLLTAYAKNRKTNLTPSERRDLSALAELIVATYGGKP